MFVKICGITSYEDAKCAVDAGVDALGFNFFEKSPRYISPIDAQVITRRLPPKIWRVGVFVNSGKDEIEKIARTASLDTLQFHGDESPEFCASWKEWRVIKGLRLTNADQVDSYISSCDYILADAYSEDSYGGTGKRLSEEILIALKAKNVADKVILAGGLNASNVQQALKIFTPFGVDVASGVEKSPREKDLEKIMAFMKAVS